MTIELNPPTLDLLPDEVEEDLRSTVRAWLANAWAPEAVAATFDAPLDDVTASLASDRKWAAELGLAGLLVPENLGGAGASVSMAAVVANEIGRAVAPARFFSSAVLATFLAARAGAQELAAELATGQAFATVAFPATNTTLHADRGTDVVADATAVNGTVPGVIEALGTDYLVVVTGQDESTQIAVAKTAQAQVSPFLAFDQTRRLADVTFSATPLQVVLTGQQAAQVVAEARAVALAVLASEQAGVASRAFEITLDYIKGRRQFGRLIGSFQAIKHRMADAWLSVSTLEASATAAARTADAYLAGDVSAEELTVAALTAQSLGSDVAVLVTEEAVQFHGGNGMTWEYPLHLFLKRAKANEQVLGHTGKLNRELGECVGLPAQ